MVCEGGSAHCRMCSSCPAVLPETPLSSAPQQMSSCTESRSGQELLQRCRGQRLKGGAAWGGAAWGGAHTACNVHYTECTVVQVAQHKAPLCALTTACCDRSDGRGEEGPQAMQHYITKQPLQHLALLQKGRAGQESGHGSPHHQPVFAQGTDRGRGRRRGQ